MRCRGIMEPSRSCVENQMLYVVAFEEGTPLPSLRWMVPGLSAEARLIILTKNQT